MTSSEQRPLSAFRVLVEFTARRTVVSVGGELDVASAPSLTMILDPVVAQGSGAVVFDLAELDFIDSSGLRVLAGAARNLDPSRGKLVLRAPSAMLQRLLVIAGMTELVHVELAKADPDHLGPEETEVAVQTRAVTEDEPIAPEIGRVMAIPAGTDVVEGALRLVVNLARATVGGADGVSVSLLREGRVMTVAASDQTVREMDADQYATGEGPCLDASLEGRWFHAESLDQETRWPKFTPRARALGILAILSSPLLVGDRPVGALNIYSRTAVAFAAKEQELAAVFAGEVSHILSDAGIDVEGSALAARVRLALQRRHVLAIALGVLMEREDVDEQSAFTLLRRFSQHSGRPLVERAEDVVASATRSGHGPAIGPSP